jgi:plastocyanin
MFKSKKFWLLWIAAIAVALMMPSCSDSPDTEGGEEEKPTPTLTVPGTYYYNDYLHITFASGGIVRISDDDDLDIRGTFTVTGSTFTLSGITGVGWAEGTWTIVNATTVKDSDGDEWTRGTLIPIPEITASLTVPGTYYYSDTWHITFADDGVVRVVTSSLGEIGSYTVDGATFTLSGIDGADWITGTWTIVDAETIIDSDGDDWVLGTLIPIPEPGTAPTITTTTLADGTVGVEYSQTLAAAGDTPITWEISDGELPDGLSLTGNTISGTPTVAGMFEFAVTARNDEGSDTEDFTIEIEGPAGPVEVDISELATATAIRDAIHAALDVSDEVVVIGEVSGITSALNITVPVDKNLKWEAEYAGSNAFNLGGLGDFILADGGKIISSGSGSAVVNLSSSGNTFGGTITIGADGEIVSAGTAALEGIRVAHSENPSTIRVEGGTIETRSNPIYVTAAGNPIIFIESGLLHRNVATSSNFSVELLGGRIHISGGTVSKAATGGVIRLGNDAEIYVSGTPTIAEGGISRSILANTVVGYYSGDNLEKFLTTGGAANERFTVDENLHNETPDWAE